MADPPYDAIVLAGGAGRRLGGTDKPALAVSGRTLLDRVLGAVGEANNIVVVGPRRATRYPVRWAREKPPGGGPVAGLRAALPHVEAGQVALLAADLPFLTGRQIDLLRHSLDDSDGALFVDDTGHPQYLVGVWRTVPLRRALASYGGAALRGLAALLHPAQVTSIDQPPPWFDVDTPPDLDRARIRGVASPSEP